MIFYSIQSENIHKNHEIHTNQIKGNAEGSVEHNYEPVDKPAKEILQKTGSQIKPMLVLSMAREKIKMK
jgi:hypothetical protein